MTDKIKGYNPPLEVDQYQNVHPEFCQAIEKNQDTFLALLDAIHKDMNHQLVKYTNADDGEEIDPESKVLEDHRYPIKHLTRLLVGTYVIAFLTSRLDISETVAGALQAAHDNGTRDGHIYLTLKSRTRH